MIPLVVANEEGKAQIENLCARAVQRIVVLRSSILGSAAELNSRWKGEPERVIAPCSSVVRNSGFKKVAGSKSRVVWECSSKRVVNLI